MLTTVFSVIVGLWRRFRANEHNVCSHVHELEPPKNLAPTSQAEQEKAPVYTYGCCVAVHVVWLTGQLMLCVVWPMGS